MGASEEHAVCVVDLVAQTDRRVEIIDSPVQLGVNVHDHPLSMIAFPADNDTLNILVPEII